LSLLKEGNLQKQHRRRQTRSESPVKQPIINRTQVKKLRELRIFEKENILHFSAFSALLFCGNQREKYL
jgi:hypothetical protein